MRLQRLTTRFLPALLAAFLLLSSAAAAQQAVVGRDGTVLRLLNDRYGTLFPDGVEAAPESSVLALEITRADGTSERLLVPETASHLPEIGPSLVYEEVDGVVFLLWEGLVNNFHPLLFLSSFDGESFGPTLEITGNPFASKSEHQLVVTRDGGGDESGERRMAGTGDRTTLHVVWWEEVPGGSRKRYAPIVLDDGAPPSSIPSWSLNDLLPAVSEELFSEVHELLTLQPGADHRSVVVGFLSPTGDRLATLAIEVLPLPLVELADKARIQIINIGNKALDRRSLADQVTHEIFANGDAFHISTLSFMTDRVRELIVSSSEPLTATGAGTLGDNARIQIINIGSKLGTSGLDETAAYKILEIPRNDGGSHLLKATILAVRPAPEEMGPGARLYVGARGGNAIVAWNEEGFVRFVESQGEGWSVVQSIALGDDLGHDAAQAMLAARVRDH